jgi:hypothetical protein
MLPFDPEADVGRADCSAISFVGQSHCNAVQHWTRAKEQVIRITVAPATKPELIFDLNTAEGSSFTAVYLNRQVLEAKSLRNFKIREE